ncbi:MAG TPA: protease pro-enzyme activation domain-containing protein [Terracidiphilus sp.]|nr:protease pro-enzyme activation domain-containing protein [Bryobacteraceae bacterium]HKF47460.1 protease pro-enzyme activation domain-containing protein [Terracidiphilus sp.]
MKTIFAPSRRAGVRIFEALAGCILATCALYAQSPAARIQSEINSAEQAVLRGSQHPLAQPQYDAGRMPGDMRINGMTMYFSRSAAQEAALDALIAAQQNPNSPQYHQWLTPDQFAARFGMAQSDLDTVQTWLEQQGFAIDSTSRSRNAIRFSGTAREVELAFQTQMHYYVVGGEKHYAPSTALSLPAAIAPVVSAVRNLNDFRPRPQHIVGRGNFTSASSGNVFFSPGDILTTYDVNPLLSNHIDGTGQTIAVMGQSAIVLADIEAFQAAASLPKKDPTLVIVPGTGDSTTSPGDESESDLDLEWSGSIAQGATIDFVYTGSNTNFGVYDAAQYAIDNAIAPIISLSYASCEPQLSTADYTTLDAIFKQATVQGETVLAASGDQGATACYGDTALSATEQGAVAVNYPASSAYVTGVGGTEISAADSTSSNSTYWTAAIGNTDAIVSAKTYIPEITWNDDAQTAVPGCSNGGAFCVSATGGGVSTLVNRPSWQTGVPGIASGTMRLVPDISFYSSPGLPGYLYCTSDKTSWQTGQAGSCASGFRDGSSQGFLTVAGGTSFATPIFAGMVALLNQNSKYVTGAGNINPMLYLLAANSANYTNKVFHDVTSGTNACTQGSSVCPGSGGYSAGPGYDEVTGLGSVDLNLLAPLWPPNTGTSATMIATSTTVSGTPANPAPGASVTFTITVASTSGSTVPTGTVTLQVDGGTSCGGVATTCGGTTVSNQTLASNGTVTYTTTSFTAAGVHQVLAQYSGDATHAASAGVGEIVITSPSSGKGTFGVAATNVTVSQGSTGASTITVTPASGYTGTVLLNFTTNNNSALQNLCYSFTTMNSSGEGTVAVSGTAAVTTQLTFDTNASDCTSAAMIKGKGMHSFRSLHAAGGQQAANRPGKRNGVPPLGADLAFAGLVLVGFLGRKSRWLRNTACVLALMVAGLALSACGSSVSTSVPNPPKGTYTVTVTGQDSATSTITSNTTFTFVID